MITPTAVGQPLPAATTRPQPAGGPLRLDRGQLWRDLAGAALISGAYAVLVGVVLPRGPVTAGEGVIQLLTAVAVGWAAGVVARSRWAMALAPVVFALVFEIVRVGAHGPTVDGLRLEGTYGILAAVSGRGVHGILVLAPLVLGAALGAGAARRIARTPTRGAQPGSWALRIRRLATAGSVLVLGLVGVLVARPGATEPILGADGRPVPGSVAELTRVDAGGRQLSVLIRGADSANPVLLYLAGGPGGTELGAMHRHGQALEQHFVVATLDQRGTGSSYDQLEPTDGYTVEAAVQDVVAVTRYLADRFGEHRIYLVGQSWGSILGVLTARDHPQLFHAFVGVGQMVSPTETDRIFYADTLDWAHRTGNAALADQLEGIGPPPYADLLDYPVVLGHEQQVYAYDHSANAEGAGQMLENLPVAEYGPMDTVNIVRGLLDTFATLYPQLHDVDLRATASELAVPVYLAQGAHEARGRAEPAADWYAGLRAPAKRWVDFGTSGHRPLFEQPDEFARLMSQTVLPETSKRTEGAAS